jgi:hypothetical protein
MLNNLSTTTACLRLPKIWKIHPIIHVSLIEPFVNGNPYFNLNTVLKTSDVIKITLKYDIDKVIGSRDKDGKG